MHFAQNMIPSLYGKTKGSVRDIFMAKTNDMLGLYLLFYSLSYVEKQFDSIERILKISHQKR